MNTEGNPYTLVILRGDLDGGKRHGQTIITGLYDKYQAARLKNISVLMGCNHGNADKHFERQIRIAKEVAGICDGDRTLGGFVKGLMVESYLEDGAQLVGGGVYGKSITGPCLGMGENGADGFENGGG